jgi:hypothetical protein
VSAALNNITANICGDGYELQTSTFLGTENYCSNIGISARGKRRCARAFGVPQTDMNIHKNNAICIKRNPDLTYHILLENFRKESCIGGIKCGSLTDAQK